MLASILAGSLSPLSCQLLVILTKLVVKHLRDRGGEARNPPNEPVGLNFKSAPKNVAKFWKILTKNAEKFKSVKI